MHTRIVFNDPPYGAEGFYNGLRLAHALIKHDGDVTVFLMGDAVVGGKAGSRRRTAATTRSACSSV
jgi:uncharacterized protein involved in oxidation of intracellular sulfur